MRKQTNLAEVKLTALALLSTEINETPYSPMIVKHPFTDTGVSAIPDGKGGVEMIDLTEDDAQLRWRQSMARQIDKADNAYAIYMMVTKPYALTFLKFAMPHLSREDMSQILASAWTRSEAPHQDVNVTVNQLLRMFKQADPTCLMEQDEYIQFKTLDDTVTVYRGVTPHNDKSVKALSWSLNQETAEWFAHRFGENGTVYEAQIDKKHIYAYFSGRNESEVIVDPSYLTLKIKKGGLYLSTYIFTDAQKEHARQTDLVSLLRSQGETLKRSGSEYEWKDGSAKVTIRGNLWFHQYEQKGGDAIDFVRRFYNKSYPEAMEYLLGGSGGTLITSPPIVKEVKPFVLPPKNDNMRRAYAYLLNRRGIDKDVLNAFAYKKMIYESEKYHNVVFVGYDKDGIPRHASMRGTGSESTYKGNAPNSQPEYSFHWTGTSRYLCLFEAPVDMLSFISMHKENWRSHSYAACCGVADHVLWQMIKDNPNIGYVYLCLDSDEPGQAAAHKISRKLSEKGIQTQILVPIHKDWNEDLLYPNEESEVEEPCQVLVL